MGSEKMNGDTADSLGLVRNMVSRFPVGCACYRIVFSQDGAVADYEIVRANERFERLVGLKNEQFEGKGISDALWRLRPESVKHILDLGEKAYRKKTKTAEFYVSILDRPCKVSLLYISDSLMLGLYQPVQPPVCRRLYRHTLPDEVIRRSLSDRTTASPACPDGPAPEPPGNGVQLRFLGAENTLPEPEDLVFRDALTGLYDRMFALSALEMYLAQGAVPVSVVLGDINGLSATNDTLGYAAGDDLLVRAARTLRDGCRAEDIVARWGDDEFLILLPCTSGDETQRVLKRLQAALAAQCGGGDGAPVTFGYATAEDGTRPAESLLREAEAWVYRKKLLVDRSARSGILRLLLSILHEKSADTQEHSERLTSYCRKIAARLGLSSEALNELTLVAVLHDIGKVGVRRDILMKPGPLTPEERREIQEHPEIGYRITRNIPELSQVSKDILAHHERWDGGGYPSGLCGEEIPLASRIVAVADAFDVMISGRPYRGPRSVPEALAELERCAGTQFDPQIVEIMAELVRRESAAPTRD